VKLANRLDRLGTETAFAVAATAADWLSKGNEVFPFHLGDLNLPTPANISAAMQRAVAEGKTGYCPNAGIAPLRLALAESLGKQRNVVFAPENIAVQPGGKPVIGKFLRAVMNPGDEVLYPNPGFPIYESQIEFNDGIAVPYRYLDTPNGFQIDLDYLKSKINSKTKALILNDQQNPLAAEMTDAERQALADLANKHNLWVLSDEAYFDIRYAGESKSIVSLAGMQDRTVILYTFSKKFAMTGWRLGWMIAPADAAKAAANLQSHLTSNVSNISQRAAIAALTGDQAPIKKMLEAFDRRRKLAVSELSKIDGMKTPTPQGAFYVYPDVTGLFGKEIDGRKFASSLELADFILEKAEVALVPGEAFGPSGFLRLSYALGDDQLLEGIQRLQKLFG